jgi:N-methylhydantoinase A/oxoprolinase/acetone carboxylase beta subunit
MRRGDAATLVGIDVGGTYTDAVVVRAGRIAGTAKIPTHPRRLAESLLSALDTVMAGISPREVVRVSISTTLITNLLAQGLAPKVATLLVPGPGLDPAIHQLGGPSWVVTGAIDFRGRERTPLDRTQVVTTLNEIHEAGYRHLAIVGKFSPRNPSHENHILEWAKLLDPEWELRAGHTVSGRLNFPRRAAATALTLAISKPYHEFSSQLQDALTSRDLTCPMVILKADGGTLPLSAAERAPLQSIFSGPVASAMGVLALRPEGASSIVVDVGGTTTDLALILDSGPLFSSKGGSLDGVYLPTRALAVRSLPVGGDSSIDIGGDGIHLHMGRAGIAACLGGPKPTLTDALRILGRTEVGDAALARAAVEQVARKVAMQTEDAARVAVEAALSRIATGVSEMLLEWQREPVYRIWELKQREALPAQTVVGVGAAAASLVPALAKRLNLRAWIPPHAPVANALGAAVARTTFTTTVHVDTERGQLEIAEEGVSEPLASGTRYTLNDAKDIARTWMARRGKTLGVTDALADSEVVLAEQFNVVDGWRTVGRIYDVCLERRCGLVAEWERPTAPAAGASP